MTLQDFKYHVLLKLGVVAAGDAPNADDGATVITRYTELHGALDALSLCNWGASENIPDAFALPIVAMTAAECARDFGNADPEIQLMGKLGLPAPSPAERQLRQLMAATYVSRPVESEYF